MATDPLDFDGLLAEAPEPQGDGSDLPGGTVIGHVHLHVADLAAAVDFYENKVGFERMMVLGDHAAFLSVGGYHHHIGLNTWAGVGAPPPPENAVGLERWTLVVPDEAAERALAERLRTNAGAPNGHTAQDPSGNRVHFVTG